MGKKLDLTNEKFGRLVVIAKHHVKAKGAKSIWQCECECGKAKLVTTGNLRSGNTVSCGCYKRDEFIKNCSKETHGHTKGYDYSPTYWTWKGMLDRCKNKKNPSYRNYGGRGIKVCEEWQSFANFLLDMGERPLGLTLDRINPNGNYEKENCRWADDITQAANKRG